MPVAFRRVPVSDSFHGDYHDNNCPGPADGSRDAQALAVLAQEVVRPSPPPQRGSFRAHLLTLISDSSVQPLDEKGPTDTHPAQKSHDGLRLSHKLVDIEASSNERSSERTCAVRLLHVSAVSPPPCTPNPHWQEWLQAPKNLNPRYSQSRPGSCFSLRRANPECLPSCAGARHGGGVQG